MSHYMHLSLYDVDKIAKVIAALDSEIRREILRRVEKEGYSISQIAQQLKLPPSTAAFHINSLQRAGLVTVRAVAGQRGTAKLVQKNVDELHINCMDPYPRQKVLTTVLDIPIGSYSDCSVSDVCGMVGDTGLIQRSHQPGVFYTTERVDAQLIWFRTGYLEYRIPNYYFNRCRPVGLSFSMELCSEADGYRTDYPSDISFWINGKELCSWTSPGDFGGTKGRLTPKWWQPVNTQYGILKTVRINSDGVYLDGEQVAALSLADLQIDQGDYFSLRVGVKPDAKNPGGINLFGKSFGNYQQDIMVKLEYVPVDSDERRKEPGIPRPEFPRPDRARRRWLNLNGSWDFALFPEGSEAAEADFAQTRQMYPRSITVPFSWTTPLSGIAEDVGGVGWYRRKVRFDTPGRKFLCFGGVDYACDLYINGQKCFHHEGGYTAFEVDVTSWWWPGENCIELRAEDYRSRWQMAGKQNYGHLQGIWQTVWLEARPESFIKEFFFETRLDGQVILNAQCACPDGELLMAEFDGSRFTGTVQDGKIRLRMTIVEPKLWSPDSPYLYEGSLTLGSDVVNTYFGIRTVSAEKIGNYSRILLNGKPVYLNGVLDQGFHPEGYFTYPTEDSIIDTVKAVKALGLNMVRLHVKIEDPRKLYWLDKLGVLAMADVPHFKGEPSETARLAFENALPDILRDGRNHPCIFSWALFNETWGLTHMINGKKTYLPETREWVRSMYLRAKELEPTRLIDDNSTNGRDHVQTDLNTWHFYPYGYEKVRKDIDIHVSNLGSDSTYNFISGNTQGDAPLINTECGMVWGVKETAGDSDLAWQYHYMLNEFRLHEAVCGFVFTQLHDVLNEFNGFYRITGEKKDFGYEGFCRDMTLRDLHSQYFVATDCPPCQTVKAGKRITVPLVLSCFGETLGGLSVSWELWYADHRIQQTGVLPAAAYGLGTTPIGTLELTMPQENALAVLSLYLTDGAGNILSRNFVTFDVQAPLENAVTVPISKGKAEGFYPVWSALQGHKQNFGGEGTVTWQLELPPHPGKTAYLRLEAGSKRLLIKDLSDDGVDTNAREEAFVLGYRKDRGSFKNSYWMTDKSRLESQVDVMVNGELVKTLQLHNDWADARGVLSWHYQPDPNWLDEAGSYGEEFKIPIPEKLIIDGHLELTLRVRGNGMCLYGRNAGRFAHGMDIIFD